LYQECMFEDVKYTSSNSIHAIRNDIAKQQFGMYQPSNKEFLKAWGKQIANIRMFEAENHLDPSSQERLKQIEANIRKLNDSYVPNIASPAVNIRL
ncbi:MAG: hypothetical protein IJ873_01635, partial [Lachnospiraceae bacterium]|nr:hypothetical protein [Lachnospiraceae bacterium]